MTEEIFIDHIAFTYLVNALQKVLHPMSLHDSNRLAYAAYETAKAMLDEKQKLLKELADQKVKESTDLIHLNLTNRTRLCLMAENIYTIEQLTQCTEHRLIRTPNLGRKALNEIKDALSAMGLKLKEQ